MLTNTQIKNNIDFLLKHASAPVKYQTYNKILKKNPETKFMTEMFANVEKSNIAREIFSKQEQDGSWYSGGSWAQAPSYRPKNGHTPVSPKYTTTCWLLSILGDMGFTVWNPRVRKACEYVFSYQINNGFISESRSLENNTNFESLMNNPCRFSLILIGLAKVGSGNDPRTKKAFDVLLKWQQEDGGWISEFHARQKNWNRSCPYASYHAAQALYSINNEDYKAALHKALKFLFMHLSAKNDREIQRFFYHGHSLIHELLMFSALNIGLNKRPVQIILDWLMTLYQPAKHCFQYKGKPISKYSLRKDYMNARVAKYRLFHLIEKDWLTYYITRIMQNILHC